MFSPLHRSLSNSICNLRLQATWNRNISDTQHNETAVFTSTSGWYNSMSKMRVSLGDDEPFGTSPGSSNCSSKQRFQRSTSVKTGHVLHKGPLACGSCSSLTQQILTGLFEHMHSQYHFIISIPLLVILPLLRYPDDSTDTKGPQT